MGAGTASGSHGIRVLTEFGSGASQLVAADIQCGAVHSHEAACNAALPNASPNDTGTAFPIHRAIRFVVPKNSQ